MTIHDRAEQIWDDAFIAFHNTEAIAGGSRRQAAATVIESALREQVEECAKEVDAYAISASRFASDEMQTRFHESTVIAAAIRKLK